MRCKLKAMHAIATVVKPKGGIGGVPGERGELDLGRGVQARRCAAVSQRRDGRGDEHRRRGAAGAGRCADLGVREGENPACTWTWRR